MNVVNYENGVLNFSDAFTVDLKNLGWDPEKDIAVNTTIPCYAGGISLPVDVLARNDKNEILAILLLGFSLKEESVLRTAADVYGDSAKAASGRRPVVYFFTEGKCVSFRGLLGQMDSSPKPLPKSMLQTLTASENLQEETFFSHLLQNPPLQEQFLTGRLDSQKMNDVLSEILAKANEIGLETYYEEVASPDPESRKLLRKQAVLQIGAGEELASSFIQSQVETVQQQLAPRMKSILKSGIESGSFPKDDMSELDWTFSLLGWDRQRDVHRLFSVPCYYDQSIMLFSDYAFTAPDGTPLVFLLVDTLRLPREKQAVLGDFYARSCKKQYGVAPFIVLYDGKDFYLRSGAFCGGFQRTHDLIPAGRLVEEVACINIVEERAWKDLLAHRKELQSLSDLDERSRRQLEIVQSSSEQTQKLLQNRDYFQKEQAALHTRTNLPEEEFLEQTMGSFDYAETRKNELLLLRNFNVEKRMCIS